MKMDGKQPPKKKRVCVVVLGDFGRSPRMQYHTLSLAKQGFEVDVVAYGGSEANQNVESNVNIHQHLMRDPPEFSRYCPRILNPPSIPTLPVLVFVSWFRKIHLIVDWHNYGHTILGLTLGPRHPLVRLCSWIESFFGQKADHNLCVTRAMKEDLAANWNIEATVMYDRPPDRFQPLTVAEKHKLFMELSEEYTSLRSRGKENHEATLISENISGTIQLKSDRPAIIVSSTSWTADEDFSILLDALEQYENEAKEKKTLPKLLCLVTGKGQMKSFYEAEIEMKNFQHVTVTTMWLAPETYPKLLACGDLGVSLHGSSSGLDLPMKVVDMFGCGLPVCALTFSCLYELVKHGQNGYIFSSSEQLFGQFVELLDHFPKQSQTLEKLRNNNKAFRNCTWDQSWAQAALPLFHKRRH